MYDCLKNKLPHNVFEELFSRNDPCIASFSPGPDLDSKILDF